jgi:PPOX class probable F420-dependent enzyme
MPDRDDLHLADLHLDDLHLADLLLDDLLLDDVAGLVRQEHGLAVVATARADGTIQCSVVNAGVLPHPATGRPVVGFVTYGPVKLVNLRARPQITLTFRHGWQWLAVEGRAELAGPDDAPPWPAEGDRLRLLLREVFTAAGGTHDDWSEYDRVMAEQRRTAVLVAPARVYGPAR